MTEERRIIDEDTWRRCLLGSAALLLAWVAVLFLTTPIVALDTDLWYHLRHGEQLVGQGSIADSSSEFSFLQPERQRVNYYWLFQGLVYTLFKAAGYGGLVVLRAALVVGVLAAVGAFLLRGRHGPLELTAPVLFFGLATIVLSHRLLVVRPHGLSYLFIPLVLYLLEFGRSRILFAVPLIAVLWVNVHGVEYPVMVLIVGAYTFETLLERWRGADVDVLRLGVLAATLATVFLTPHGMGLLRVPFTSTSGAARYIAELQPVPLADFFQLEVSWTGLPGQSAFNLLMWASVVLALASVLRRTARWSHLLVLAGAFYLLTRSLRFEAEFVLLALPMLRSWTPATDAVPRRRWAVLLLAVLVLVPAVSVLDGMPNRGGGALSRVDLPHGVAAFLNQLDASGPVLNDPDTGGFFMWSLERRYKIFMDMETPFFFTDEDFFLAAQFFQDAEVLRKLLAEYRPPFIAAPLDLLAFRDLIREHRNYVPVFFDDTSVLYVDRTAYPQIARDWVLTSIDPYTLTVSTTAGLDERQQELRLWELRRVLDVEKRVAKANQAAAILCNRMGRPEEALEHVQTVIEEFPDVAQAYLIRGDALRALERDGEALRAYRAGLRHAEDERERSLALRALAALHTKTGDEKRAYRALRQAVNPYGVAPNGAEASHVDLYNLGVLALANGDVDEGRRMLVMALAKVPPEDDGWHGRIENELNRLRE